MVEITGEGDTAPDQGNVLNRDYNPEAPAEGEQSKEDVKAFLNFWEQRLKDLKQKRKPRFERMRKSSMFAKGYMWEGATDNDERYVVNIAQSEVAASVATLYAKNPTFTAKRRARMDFTIWDERPETLQEDRKSVV